MAIQRLSGAILSGWLVCASAAAAPKVWTSTSIKTGDPKTGDMAGVAVSISGDRALVGAYGQTSETGAAYLFERNPATGAWTQSAKLLSANAKPKDRFGRAVAIAGDYAIVGGPNRNDVISFERSGTSWNTAAILKPPAAEAGPKDGFGYAVSLSNTRLWVSAYLKNADRGAVYVFERGTGGWAYVGTTAAPAKGRLVATDRDMGDRFGYSLHGIGDRVLVGAPLDDQKGKDAGAAYVFERDGTSGEWKQKQKLVVDDAAAEDWLGTSVSLSSSGDRAAITAQGKDGKKGAVYLFERDGAGNWTKKHKLLAQDGIAGDLFGTSAALAANGDRLAVGADGMDGKKGSVYLFERNTATGAWTQSQKFTAQDGASNDQFGFAVALATDRAFIGAYGKESNTGRMYELALKSINGDPCTAGGECVSGTCAGGLCGIPQCAVGFTVAETFNSGAMAGCAAKIPWGSRASACGQGYHVCSASEWINGRGGKAPTHIYWTNDNLGYGGSGSGNCSATIGGSFCGTDQPMRVCTASGTDAESNQCNWTNCGLNGTTPNGYFGGCVGNLTAGVLCCGASSAPPPPPSDCTAGFTVAQTFASGSMVGCAGAIDWAARAGACATGLHVCTAAEWQSRRGGVAPTHHYWTNDNLGYGGSGSGNCSASASGTSCGANQPMRVCMPGDTDPKGNRCNWINCGLNATSPNAYFGGCVGNTAAGVLCCR